MSQSVILGAAKSNKDSKIELVEEAPQVTQQKAVWPHGSLRHRVQASQESLLLQSERIICLSGK